LILNFVTILHLLLLLRSAQISAVLSYFRRRFHDYKPNIPIGLPMVHRLLVYSRHSSRFTASSDRKL